MGDIQGFVEKVLHHGLPTWLQVQPFYNGLDQITRQMIDIVIRGTLNIETPEATMELFEEIAMNNYQWHSSGAKPY